MGRDEIRQGAKNRLYNVNIWPCLSIESGLIHDQVFDVYEEVSCCVLRTRYGTFETWSTPFAHKTAMVKQWLQTQTRTEQDTTKHSITKCSTMGEYYKVNSKAWSLRRQT